jgi:succinate dehydrogenase / fumarate reductase, flavoprotein subunit
MHLKSDVLVIGAGAAGIYAALEAAREGASVILVDRSLIGRGGATVMAQMTVAVALGEQTADRWQHHLADTLAAGRDLCDERLSAMVCEEAPARIREMDDWGVGWARDGNHIAQVQAPGHDRPRCVYVDVLSTGPAVSRTLRTRLNQVPEIRRIGDLAVVDIVVADGQACGAVAIHISSGEIVTLDAKSVVIATGGLTRLYGRNSASANMGGDGYALALRAGAELVDMEFVQFFPIGHLAPRLVGMDPIMWDPFRYKLGGQLLNGNRDPFEEKYSRSSERNDGTYKLTRDLATYAITKEVEAGRGTPAGGAYLSFRHVPESELRRAFGPVIDRLAANGIDLTRHDVEVAPMAHYHMGGVRVSPSLESSVPGLYACGEAIGGSNGANRLSGNAISEAFVFGARAGQNAAKAAGSKASAWSDRAAANAVDLLRRPRRKDGPNVAKTVTDLQTVMAAQVGPFRTQAKLDNAINKLEQMSAELGDIPQGSCQDFDFVLLDWLDLRNMLLVARSVATAAASRTESRGAQQREDHPGMDESWAINQVLRLSGGRFDLSRSAPQRLGIAA